MKTVGVIGGFRWHSTAEYYRLLNEAVDRQRAGHHSAQLATRSLDFQEILDLADAGHYAEVQSLMNVAAGQVVAAGADLVILAANTAHLYADGIRAAIDVPLLHIGDAVTAHLRRSGLRTVGLIGTAEVLESRVVAAPVERSGVTVVYADDRTNERMHAVIRDELIRGEASADTCEWVTLVVEELAAAGAQAVILGCTELSLLTLHTDTPVIDASAIHCEAAIAGLPDTDYLSASNTDDLPTTDTGHEYDRQQRRTPEND